MGDAARTDFPCHGSQSGQHTVFSGTCIVTASYCVYTWLMLQFGGRSGSTGSPGPLNAHGSSPLTPSGGPRFMFAKKTLRKPVVPLVVGEGWALG